MPTREQYFEVLGLDEPPRDRKTVKRAYSKMLKLTRPEDDPEGFMRLRDAHDQALNILQWQAEEREWEVKQNPPSQTSSEQTSSDTKAEIELVEPVSETETPSEPSLTYGDMIPDLQPESDTSYSLGPTPSFDAPVSRPEFTEPAFQPVIEKLEIMLRDQKQYNDREQWNDLFRNARQLDIDDYVDFENALLEHILRFHGYFDEQADYNNPQNMPLKLSPSLAASLFKTMSWDQVNKSGLYRSEQIDWLERRMHLRKRGVDPVLAPQTNDDGNWKIWAFLVCIFVLFQAIKFLGNS